MSGIKLIATEGMMLTNGQTYGRVVLLGANDSPDNWYEITEAAYKALMETDIFEEDEATEKDYQSALRDMGVNV